MHNRNVMPRRKLFSDWLNTYVIELWFLLDPLGSGSTDLILIRLGKLLSYVKDDYKKFKRFSFLNVLHSIITVKVINNLHWGM